MTDAGSLASLGLLPPISLADLQAEAAFQTRQDRKYLVPVATVAALLDGLDPATRVLAIDGRRAFSYTTAYFDDDQLASYVGALRRRPDRFKVRTRRYDESDLRLLEVKVRDGRGRTVKHRIGHEAACLETLTDREGVWLRGFPQVGWRAGGLRHRLTTVYRRTTLVLPGGAGRVTIDHDLVFARPEGASLTLPGVAIVETKGAGKATPFDRLLWRLGHRPQAMSKYAMGLALLVPELPANRWHRLRALLREVAEHARIDARPCGASLEPIRPGCASIPPVSRVPTGWRGRCRGSGRQ